MAMASKVCGGKRKHEETPSPLAKAVAPVLRAPNKRPRTEGRRVRFDDNEELTVPKSEAPAVDSGSATLTKKDQVPAEQKRQVKKQLDFSGEEKKRCEQCGIIMPAPYNYKPSQYTQEEMDHFAECEKIDLVPGNQLQAEWSLEEPVGQQEEEEPYKCVSCGNPNSSTIRDLRVVQRAEPAPFYPVPLKPCPATCTESHNQLQAAIELAVKHREGLDRCLCPFHRLLDKHLADKAGSPHSSWLGGYLGLECGCPALLKQHWCPDCKHFRRQTLQWFNVKHLEGGPLSFWHGLYVRDCPVEHVPVGYRD